MSMINFPVNGTSIAQTKSLLFLNCLSVISGMHRRQSYLFWYLCSDACIIYIMISKKSNILIPQKRKKKRWILNSNALIPRQNAFLVDKWRRQKASYHHLHSSSILFLNRKKKQWPWSLLPGWVKVLRSPTQVTTWTMKDAIGGLSFVIFDISGNNLTNNRRCFSTDKCLQYKHKQKAY